MASLDLSGTLKTLQAERAQIHNELTKQSEYLTDPHTRSGQDEADR